MHTRFELKILCEKQKSYNSQLNAPFSGGVNIFNIHESCWCSIEEFATDVC